MTQGSPTSLWFVKDDQKVSGPLTEAEMRALVQNSTSSSLQVKQGKSDWQPAELIRKKLRELAASGIYVCFNNVVQGPYTLTRAFDYLTNAKIEGVMVRTGKHGAWIGMEDWLAAIRRIQDRQCKAKSKTATAATVKATADLSAKPPPLVDEEVLVATLVSRSVLHSPTESASSSSVDPDQIEPPTKALSQQTEPTAFAVVPRPPAVPDRKNYRARSGRAAQSRPSAFRRTWTVLSRVAAVLLTVTLILGVLALKATKIAGKQALRENQKQAKFEEQRRLRQYSSPRRSSVAIRSQANQGRSVVARSTSNSVPISIDAGTLFRPQFITTDGIVVAGTAFSARSSGGGNVLVISALHLFGPAGGLPSDIPTQELPTRWTGMTLHDCLSETDPSSGAEVYPIWDDVPITPIMIDRAKPLPQVSAHGDVVACSVGDVDGHQFKPLPLSMRTPQAGERVWLLARVSGSSRLAHAATVEGVDDGWLMYRFDNQIELRATSGAPVIDQNGRVVGVNAGGGDSNGDTIGAGTPTSKFVGVLVAS